MIPRQRTILRDTTITVYDNKPTTGADTAYIRVGNRQARPDTYRGDLLVHDEPARA